MALVETGKMTDIKLGSTDVQLVLQGGNVIWERDRYPQVVWPEEYFYPDLAKAHRSFSFQIGSATIGFFIPDSGTPVSVWYGADATDCEGEGGDPRQGGFFNDYSGTPRDFRDISQRHPLTASTGGIWVIASDSYELTWGEPGNIFSEHNSKGMFVRGANEGRGDMCGGLVYIGTAITEHYADIEFFCIVGEHGGCDSNISDHGTSYSPYWTHVVRDNMTNLKWIASDDVTYPIYLYQSTNYDLDSMKFSVKNSRGATFIVIDNAYWRSIIPWDMADYYNVTFRDKDTNNIITR